MRRLFEEFRATKKLQNNSKTALESSLHQKRCSSVQSDYISPLALSSLSRILAIYTSNFEISAAHA